MSSANDLVAKAKESITENTVEELHRVLGDTPVIIDVREPAEYAAGHIYGAINIPRGVLEFQVEGHSAVANKLSPELQLRDHTVYLYCRTGGRSALAAESLQQMGFSKVVSVAGGFLAWEAAGFTVQHPAD